MKLKRLLALLLAAALALGSSGCVMLDQNGNPIVPETPPTQSQLFDQYLNDQFLEAAGDNLLDSRFLVRYPENFGLTDIPKTMGSIEFDKLDAAAAEWENDRKELLTFERKELDADQQLIYDLLQHELDLQKPVIELSYYDEINSPLLGIQSGLPSTLAEFRISTPQDAQDYITMLGTAGDFFGQILQYQQRRAEQGLFMSDSMLDQTIQSCKSFIEKPEENMLLDTFNTRLEQIPELTAEEKSTLREQNKTAVLESLIPAYEDFMAGMEALRGSGVNAGGLCGLPKGKEYYSYLVADGTGSSRSVNRIAMLLDKTLSEQVNRLLQMFNTSPAAVESYYDTKMNYGTPEEMLNLLRERTVEEFPPLLDLNYQIKYVHPSMEEHSSPAFYFTPPVDATGENSIYINRKYTQGQDASSRLFPTIAHEGYPGHMYQLNYFNEKKPNPIRKLLNYNGYVEGWASYVEWLSYDMGEINDPDVVELLRIDMVLMLCVSSRIDIGVNYDGWDVSRVEQYLSDFGLNPEAAEAVFEAVVQDPANYLSYCVGMLEFMELRDRAEEELGDSFVAADFHQAMLDIGPVPFSFVSSAVDDYIESALPEASKAA